ncbi:hypothetical protein D3C78_1429960 [compost metagenome]
MLIRSHMIACISWRLYFMVGVWPVWKLWDLAQPRPKRMFRLPCLAALLTAPGSSVTYRPGIPILPATRTTPISALSTSAGASCCAPSWPWPRASKPTASTAQSTSGSPSRLAICSCSGVSWVRSAISKPWALACARRSGLTSPTITTAAPSRRAEAAAASPTGPAPAIYTVLPGPTPAVTAPW